MSWRTDFAGTIHEIIAAGRAERLDVPAIRKRLRRWFLENCGSGVGYWPEKVYRDEIRRQLAGDTGLAVGKRRPLPAQAGQLLLEGLTDG